ncbi:hypothetical protein BS47DRAFT_1390662 [Hydnum rufescens UP504]|uniref:Uncharacterized protein n=1 Tax=Hydnum rufescens UP504 TaxID=1448309 RepID=A0A9P6B450_9AGAM|nr:hypothetical protein BS47DRAFT_1390662 [Hydnum rufescens UP504]
MPMAKCATGQAAAAAAPTLDLTKNSFSKHDQPGAQTSGTCKSDHHEELAALIFKDHLDYETEYMADPGRFGRAVEGHLSSLKDSYKAFQVKLGGTGAGLAISQATNATELFSPGEQFQQDFPRYEDLHSMWRENPSYNPIGVANMSTISGSQQAEDLANLYASHNNKEGDNKHLDDSPDIKGKETKLDPNGADDNFDHFIHMSPGPEEKVI